jgi:hypothetical protein
VGQAAECLLNKHKALSSNSSTMKERKERKKEGRKTGKEGGK